MIPRLITLQAFATLGLALLLHKPHHGVRSWRPKTVLLRKMYIANLIFAVVIAVNIMTAIMAAWGYKAATNGEDSISGWLWPVVIAAIFGGGIMYWLVVQALNAHWNNDHTLGHRLGFEVNVLRPTDYKTPLEQLNGPDREVRLDLLDSARDGSERRVQIQVSVCKSC